MAVPFFFAWVNEDQTTFDPATMARFDENIIDFDLKHDEGQHPTLDVVIKNPRVGLLAASRKIWAWVSYQSTTIVPLFHGILIGIPSDLFGELITLKLVGQPYDYIAAKQAVAETLKVSPNYDPIFLAEDKRDDPDAILEGWSKLYHVDRTSLQVTASDILQGEDGTVTFDESKAIYESVKMSLGEAPLTNVQVQATVNWRQRCMGFVDGPKVDVMTYTGGSFISEWPKPGTQLGGGWSVETSFARDLFGVSGATTHTQKASLHINDPEAGECSILDSQIEITSAPVAGYSTMKTDAETFGYCHPPTLVQNFSIHKSGQIIAIWSVSCTWKLRYQAERQMSELVIFNVIANTQPILTSPTETIQQHTEVITVSSADVGEPCVTYDQWTDYRGQFVPLATIIHPNDPTSPGGLSYQVCVQAGTAGSDEPTFSDVPGEITADGTVLWSSMGLQPITGYPGWADSTPIALGEIIGYAEQQFDPKTAKLEATGNFAFYLCTTPGKTNARVTEIDYFPPITTNEPQIVGTQQFFYIPGPRFNATPGAQLADGSVVWTSLGTSPAFMAIPIGGTSVNVTANSFFPSDRGQQAIQYLINRARARLRMRSRAVTIGWDCRFDDALDLSCRKNATLYDGRIPGGAATGKIKSYGLSAKGGKLLGHVTIGVAVGFGGSVPEITGTPDYAANGYMEQGYQHYSGSAVTLGDISYTPPAYRAFDDGLLFPLRKLPLISSGISGTVAEQIGLIQAENFPRFSPMGTIQVENHPVVYTAVIKPVTGATFNGAYHVSCSTLEVPQGIDLEAS